MNTQRVITIMLMIISLSVLRVIYVNVDYIVDVLSVFQDWFVILSFRLAIFSIVALTVFGYWRISRIG